jgi:1,2-diacylglycerol 3-alpha-glucosyltransferase
MRIILMTETWHPYTNGVITHISGLADGLRKTGHEVLIITADPEIRHHVVDSEGVLHCPAIAVKKVYGYGLASPFSLKRYALVRDFSPDVIHIHQEFGMGFFGLIASRLLGIPLVYTLHTAYDEYLHYLATPVFLPMVRTISRSCVRWLANSASIVTGPSEKASDYLRSCGVHTPFHYIPNSVENQRFNPAGIHPATRQQIRQQFSLDNEILLALFVGRLGKEKNVSQLLSFWKEADFAGDNIHLMIAGDGPERTVLENQAASIGIGSQVTFTGKIPYAAMSDLYASADLYITASTTEMMSISMLEARAMGLPTIQQYDAWNEHQVKEGFNGFYFQDAASMGEKVRRLMRMNSQERLKLQEQCRQSVAKQGTADLAQLMTQLYCLAVYGVKPEADTANIFYGNCEGR